MASTFLGGEVASGESAWWRGNWIPRKGITRSPPFFIVRETIKFKNFFNFWQEAGS